MRAALQQTLRAMRELLTVLALLTSFATSMDSHAAQSQSITFTAVADQFAGAAPIVVNATATSGLPVTFATITPAIPA